MTSSPGDAFGTVTPGSSPTTSLVATEAKFWPSTSSPPFFDMKADGTYGNTPNLLNSTFPAMSASGEYCVPLAGVTTTTAVTHEAQPRSSTFVTAAERSCFSNSPLLELDPAWQNADFPWTSQNRVFDYETSVLLDACHSHDSTTSSTTSDHGVRSMAHTNDRNDLVIEENSNPSVNDAFPAFQLNSTRNSPPIVSAPSIFPAFNNNALSTLDVGGLNGAPIPLDTMVDQIPALKQRTENPSLDEAGGELEGECGSREDILMVASPSSQDVNRRRLYGQMSSPSSSEETENWSAKTPTLGSSLPCSPTGPLTDGGLARSLSGPCVGTGFNSLADNYQGPPYLSRSHSSSTMPYHAYLRPGGMPIKPHFLPPYSYMDGASLDLKEMERTRPKRRNVKISKDPQSVAARHRRARISDRMRLLQRLVPGGTKMDTASMLDEAILYVKYLQEQVKHFEHFTNVVPHHQYPSSFFLPRANPNPSPSSSPSPQSFGTQDGE